MSKITEALDNYKKLLQKVDEKFRSLQSKFPQQMKCGKGCHQCCLPSISVMRVEKENIKIYLQKNTDILEKVRANKTANPFQGKRCQFLAKDGSCLIYSVRPVVCRSHGAPIKISLDDIATEVSDVCPLNFTGQPVAGLPEGDHIRLNTLNTILATINQQYVAAVPNLPEANAKAADAVVRFPLEWEEILK